MGQRPDGEFPAASHPRAGLIRFDPLPDQLEKKEPPVPKDGSMASFRGRAIKEGANAIKTSYILEQSHLAWDQAHSRPQTKPPRTTKVRAGAAIRMEEL